MKTVTAVMKSDAVPTFPLSSMAVWIGLFTVSWDRFASVSIGGFNVKIATAAFILAMILTFVDWLPRRLSGVKLHIIPWLTVVVVIFAGVGLFADNIVASQLQTVTVFLGAIIPFTAVYVNLKLFPNLDAALTAFIMGGWFAAGFGLYQLLAFYTGLPQLIAYEAKGGGLGRISSFSYEAGYFGYYLILVIAALFARAALREQSVNRIHLIALIGILLLANSRATFLTFPILLVLLFFSWPKQTTRTKLLPLVFVGSFALLFISLALPNLFGTVIDRATSLLDPSEATSNAPRLFSYAVSLEIISQNLVTGIGAGNLIDHAPLHGRLVDADATANSVVANNIWLQALLDGGILLFAAQIGFVLCIVSTLFRRAYPVSRALMAGWIAAFVVASAITSYYWDMKLWVVLALAAAARSLDEQRRGPDKAADSASRRPIQRSGFTKA